MFKKHLLEPNHASQADRAGKFVTELFKLFFDTQLIAPWRFCFYDLTDHYDLLCFNPDWAKQKGYRIDAFGKKLKEG